MPSDGASGEAFDVKNEMHFGSERDTVYRLNAVEVINRLGWLEYSVRALKTANELMREDYERLLERVKELEDDRR
jgi:hypothetical protein